MKSEREKSNLNTQTKNGAGGLTTAEKALARLRSYILPSEKHYNHRVCQEYDYIYVHIPKTAGQSIEKVLSSLPRDRSSLRRVIPAAKHAQAQQTRTVAGKEFWDRSFKFAFVRNPWDLMVSSYHWWLHTGPQFSETALLAKVVAEFGGSREFILSG